MKENTEKVVVIFDRVDQTAITVIESLGGEIQPKESVENKQHPLIGKWVRCVDRVYENIVGKWFPVIKVTDEYIYIKEPQPADYNVGFLLDLAEKVYNLTDARDYNPDEVKALVGKLVKHKQSGEYHEFVESDDEGCEVEGVVVCVREGIEKINRKISDQYIMYNAYDLKDFKEKEVELLVPDNVKFYDWAGDIALEVSEGMFLSDDGLGDFTLTTSSSGAGFYPVKCKLVPVKYEDVQVGDFVVRETALRDSATQYSMKHGDKKFCQSRAKNLFSYNNDWYDEQSDLLKVVRC